MNPLNNHRQSLILGVILALILAVFIGGTHFYELGLARWFHIVSGVFWIGLLYYFNVVQTPALAAAAPTRAARAARAHQVRGPAGASLVPLDGARHFDRRSLAPGARGHLQRRRSSAPASTTVPAEHRHRRVARHHHAAERLATDLAEPEEDSRHHSRRATRRRPRPQGRRHGLARELRALHPDAHVHAAASHGLPSYENDLVPELPRDLPIQVEAALAEDIGTGDVTAALVPAAQRVRGRVITREPGGVVRAGVGEETFRRLDPRCASTGTPTMASAERRAVLLEIAGPARPILTGERTALNFLQLLSGTATARAPMRMRSPGLPADPRHAQDAAGIAQRAEVRRALRRRRQPPPGPL